VNAAQLLSWAIPASQLSATVLVFLIAPRWPTATAWGATFLVIAHVMIVAIGWVQHLGGFQYLQPANVAANFVACGYSWFRVWRRHHPRTVPKKGKHAVTDLPAPSLVRFGQRATLKTPQGQALTPMIDAKTAPVRALSSCRVFMPGGGLSRLHVHRHTELIVIVTSGYAATLHGPDLEPVIQEPGTHLHIAPGVPHIAVNLSATEAVLATEVRTDPTGNDDTELLAVDDELDKLIVQRVAALRATHRATMLARA
jgi:uncharacterized RmlC-like cupin family protein